MCTVEVTTNNVMSEVGVDRRASEEHFQCFPAGEIEL